MKKSGYLSFVILISVATQLLAGCVTWNNFYVHTKPGPTGYSDVSFVSARNRRGWFGVALAKNRTMSGSTMIMAWANSTSTEMLQLDPLTHRPISLEYITNKTVANTEFEKAYNYFPFTFRMPDEILNGTNSVAIAFYLGESPKNFEGALSHQRIKWLDAPSFDVRMITFSHCRFGISLHFKHL